MVATLLQVCVLGLVQSHAPALASVWRWESHRVPVPVVSIELNHEPTRRHEGINAELVCKNVLRGVLDAEPVQDRVAGKFYLCRFPILLHLRHPQHLLASGRVRISACKRAVLDVVGFVSRRRPTECLFANRAYVRGLVPSLPIVMTSVGTKISVSCWGVKPTTTREAINFTSFAPVRTAAPPRTARLIAAPESWLKDFSAKRTRLGRNARSYPFACATTKTSPFSVNVLNIELCTALFAGLGDAGLSAWAWPARLVMTALRAKVSIGNKSPWSYLDCVPTCGARCFH